MSNKDFDDLTIPSQLPLLPVLDVVVFPFMALPLFVSRESSIQAVNEAFVKNRLVFLTSQKSINCDNPKEQDLYNVGTIAMIVKMRKLPDGRLKIMAHGIGKAKIKSLIQSAPYFMADLDRLEDNDRVPETPEEEALFQTVKDHLKKIINLGKALNPIILSAVERIDEMGKLCDLVASNLGLKVFEAQEILETSSPWQRLLKIQQLLEKELQILELHSANTNTPKTREEFIRDQIRQMKNDLGGNAANAAPESDPKAEEIKEIRRKIEAAKMSEDALKESTKQVNRLERMHPDSSEATIVRTYLDWLCEIPWTSGTEDNLNLKNAMNVLDKDHFGLEKVKDRILEFLAVRKLKSDNKGPILCLGGPPGVGKTSLGKSIAACMGREFVRISLGGVHDEAEIRGHRRTYVGAMPGRLIQAIKQAGTNNPVIMLDEIDKLGQDHKGDPSSALLEVLDPEQNNSFRDHYLNIPFDLSNVMFICTANVVHAIPQALRDRMEVINLSGYTQEDKIKIAKQYLFDKQIKENGLLNDWVEFKEDGVQKIIGQYTREAGLRNLERLIGSCCRKVAKEYATFEGSGDFKKVNVTAALVEKYLGPPQYIQEDRREKDEVACVTGLAWTQFGGEVLEVEASLMPGKGGFKCTGSLGEVMKESCQTAYSWLRSQAFRLKISPEFFKHYEIHIHFPSGAVPKDGPSAGITITTALVSLLTGIPVSRSVAMTGEISLHGKVLPIGGLKDKSLAAMRYGIETVIISKKNEKDLVDIPEEYRKKINFVSAETVDTVLETALVESPFKDGKKPNIFQQYPQNRMVDLGDAA